MNEKVNTAPAMLTFAAIDFETADYCRDSACAVGVVRVQGDKIVARHYELIRHRGEMILLGEFDTAEHYKGQMDEDRPVSIAAIVEMRVDRRPLR